MAMDTRRHYNNNFSDGVIINQKAFPGLVVLGLGCLFLIVGVILLAAVGVPNNVSEKPATIVGPLITCLGAVMCVVGGIMAYVLKQKGEKEKKRARAEQREIERQQAEETQRAARARAAAQQGGGVRPVPATHHHHHPNAPMPTGPHFNSRVAPEDQHYQQQQYEGYDQNYEGYNQEYSQEYEHSYDQNYDQNGYYQQQQSRTQYTHQNDFYQPD